MRLSPSGHHGGLRDWDQLCELSEILSGGGQEELVAGTARSSQSQPPEMKDALEVGEQHLDLFTLAP